MKKNYFVRLKNGETININRDQFDKLSNLLLNDKSGIPTFIQINDDIIKVDFIAVVKAFDINFIDNMTYCKKCGKRRCIDDVDEHGNCIAQCGVKNEQTATV